MTDADKLVEDCARAMFDDLAIREGAWQRWDDAEGADQEFAKQQARAALALAVERCAEMAETAHEKVFLEPTPSENLVAIKAASLIRALSPNAKGET